MKPCATSVLLCIVIALAAAGCKKGDTGAEGPPGTANVIYSAWFKPSAYTQETLFGTVNFYYDQASPQITQEIIDKGAVLVFGKLEGYNPAYWPTGQIGQLPVTLSYVQGGQQKDIWTANITPGKLRIRFTNDHNIYTSISTAHSFRYVIIPGGKAIAALHNRTYREIANLYHLSD